jgi:RNA polymerase sigma factor (sigma-70 family)
VEYQRLVLKAFTWPEQQKLLRAVRQGDREAEEKLIRSYLPMILRQAAKWARSYPEQHDEMVHVGMIAASKAIRNFDVDRGNKLITVMVRYVQVELIKFIENNYVIRIPSVSFAEDAADHIAACRDRAVGCASLDVVRVDGQGLHDVLVDKTLDDPLDRVLGIEEAELRYQRRLAVQRAIDCLDQRRQFVLRGRMAGQTLDEVGRTIGGVTRERVRQLEMSAMRDLEKILRRMGATRL